MKRTNRIPPTHTSSQQLQQHNNKDIKNYGFLNDVPFLFCVFFVQKVIKVKIPQKVSISPKVQFAPKAQNSFKFI